MSWQSSELIRILKSPLASKAILQSVIPSTNPNGWFATKTRRPSLGILSICSRLRLGVIPVFWNASSKKFLRKRAPILVLYRFFLAAFVQRSPQLWTSVFVLATGRRARHTISGDFHGDTARKLYLPPSTSTPSECLVLNSTTVS